MTIIAVTGSVGLEAYHTSAAAAAKCATSLAAVGMPRRSSTKETAARLKAITIGSQSCAAPNQTDMAAPRKTAIPPVRGTGRSCKERSLGVSSTRVLKRDRSRRRTTHATANDRIPSPANIPGILAAQVPIRRRAQVLLERDLRVPAQLTANEAVVCLERGSNLQWKPSSRKWKQSRGAAKRPAYLATKLRGGKRWPVRDEKCSGRVALAAAENRVGEIGYKNKATAVRYRRYRQWNPASDRFHQQKKIRLHARPIHERRTQYRQMQPRDGTQRFLGPRLRIAIGIPRRDWRSLTKRRIRFLAVDFDRTYENHARAYGRSRSANALRKVNIHAPQVLRSGCTSVRNRRQVNDGGHTIKDTEIGGEPKINRHQFVAGGGEHRANRFADESGSSGDRNLHPTKASEAPV